MKEYQVVINRTYTTYVTLRFSDDGRNHKEIINEKISNGEQMIWDLISEKELEQMEVSGDKWEISEINNTRTGALSNDTGPRNEITMENIIDKIVELIRDELAASQVNKDNESKDYLTGKNEAYLKVLSTISSTKLKKWEQDH